MKKLRINQNFLPKRYVEEKIKRDHKNNVRACKILSAFFIFMIPLIIKGFLKGNEEIKIVKKDTSFSVEQMTKWTDYCDNNVKIDASNDKIEFDIPDKENLIRLCKNSNIEISDIESSDIIGYKITGKIKNMVKNQLSQNNNKKSLATDEIISNLNEVQNVDILSIKKENDKYSIKVNIRSSKEEINNLLDKLNIYKFTDYKLQSENFNITGTITLEY